MPGREPTGCALFAQNRRKGGRKMGQKRGILSVFFVILVISSILLFSVK